MRMGIIGLFLTLTACGDDASGADAGGAGGDGAIDVDASVVVDVTTTTPGGSPIAPSTACMVTTWREPSRGATHLAPCSEIAFPSHPPASGPHYGAWADFGAYDAPVPWGFLVHSMEHGAVVLAYDCPDGCDDVLLAFEALIADRGEDAACGTHPTARSRFVVTPDPALPDGSIAAVAWEHAYVATCLDEPSLRAFVDAHYAMAPEDFCSAGVDESAGGWCP